MSCLLCDSMYHLSHNCDKYELDESRQKALVSKSWCPNCLLRVTKDHAKKWDRCPTKDNKRCYLCFLREHHTLFCPDRRTLPNMIVPAIDEDLHKRFFYLFKDLLLENYFLAFLSQKMFNTINAWPNGRPSLGPELRITNAPIQFFDSLKTENDAGRIERQRQNVLSVTNEVNLNNINTYSYIYKCTLKPGIDHKVFFKAKEVILNKCDIPDKAFLKLLSNYTRILECHNVELTPTVKFVDVLQRAQNVQELILDDTNISTDHLWVDNLLRYKNSNNFLKLEIEIPSYNFNIEALTTFIKTKCVVDDVELKFYIDVSDDDDDDDLGHGNELLDKLSNYFENEVEKDPILIFGTVRTHSHGDKEYRNFASFTKLISE